MRIVVVEDDYHQRDWLAGELSKAFSADVEPLNSFGAFHRRFKEFEQNPPDYFVVDVMLVSDQLSEENDDSNAYDDDEEQVDDVEDLRQGLIAVKMIGDSASLRRVPATLYTVLTRQDLPDGIVFMPKQEDISALAAEIRRRLGISK